jgi:glycosyltransferase involved in cell wall biosynthesis
MKILYLSSWHPFPPDNGIKIRIFNLLKALTEKNEVTLVCFKEKGTNYIDSDINIKNIKTHTLPNKIYNPLSIRSIFGIFSTTPRSIIDCYSPEMVKMISKQVSNNKYDVLIASEWLMASYAYNIHNIPMIFEDVELAIFRDNIENSGSLIHKFRYKLTFFKLKAYLRSILPNFSACTVVSKQEKLILQSASRNFESIEIIPNMIDLKKYSNVRYVPIMNTLIFTGSFTYNVNYRGMVWFMDKVYPLISEDNPDIKVTITGDHAGLALPNEDKVILTGMVDEIYPLIASSWISIAPIFEGAGTRLKILEAMALKTPVVTTSKGAEGLDVESGKHLWIADTPQDFAEAVLTILKDEGLRNQLIGNAYEIIQQNYDSSVILPGFLRLVEEIGASK